MVAAKDTLSSEPRQELEEEQGDKPRYEPPQVLELGELARAWTMNSPPSDLCLGGNGAPVSCGGGGRAGGTGTCGGGGNATPS